jgi:hypothetical protein
MIRCLNVKLSSTLMQPMLVQLLLYQLQQYVEHVVPFLFGRDRLTLQQAYFFQTFLWCLVPYLSSPIGIVRVKWTGDARSEFAVVFVEDDVPTIESVAPTDDDRDDDAIESAFGTRR